MSRSIRLLSVQPDELPLAIERALADAKSLRKSLKDRQVQLALHEAARLVQEAPSGPPRVVVAVMDGWDAAGLKAIASAAAGHPRTATALFTSGPPAAVVISCSSDLQLDANGVLKALSAQFGGRGGGTQELAQGGGLDGSGQEWVGAARRLIEAAVGASGDYSTP